MKDAYIATIRKACIEANPEIVELKAGLQLKWDGKVTTLTGETYNSGNLFYIISPSIKGIDSYLAGGRGWEILGRPIRLADVLLLLGNGWTRSKLTGKYDLDQNCQAIVCQWSMTKDDLILQSEETLKFLSALLANKN